jgi:hypothetical protein
MVAPVASPSSVEAIPAFELEILASRNLVDCRLRDAELLDEVFVEHADAAARDRPHRELGMARDAELADNEHIHRSPKRPGDLERHRHPAAGQPQHDDVGTVGEPAQRAGQPPAGIVPVLIAHVRIPAFGACLNSV